jgi:hypothetical protein
LCGLTWKGRRIKGAGAGSGSMRETLKIKKNPDKTISIFA